jgi:hypothetical protein
MASADEKTVHAPVSVKPIAAILLALSHLG